MSSARNLRQFKTLRCCVSYLISNQEKDRSSFVEARIDPPA